MKLVAVADIFGRTSMLEDLVSRLSDRFSKIDILDPYGGCVIDFQDENEAYSYFKKKCGLSSYSEKVFLANENRSDGTLFLGFSVGASAIWLISGNSEIFPKTRMIGFYGSQIRNHLNITPVIRTDLFFPKSEDHFDVSKLISKMSKKKNVNCLQTEYLHGFMNKKSKNFSADGFDKYIDILNMYNKLLDKDFSNAAL